MKSSLMCRIPWSFTKYIHVISHYFQLSGIYVDHKSRLQLQEAKKPVKPDDEEIFFEKLENSSAAKKK